MAGGPTARMATRGAIPLSFLRQVTQHPGMLWPVRLDVTPVSLDVSQPGLARQSLLLTNVVRRRHATSGAPANRAGHEYHGYKYVLGDSERRHNELLAWQVMRGGYEMEDFDNDYDRATAGMQAFGLKLEGLIQSTLESNGVQVLSVMSRVKSKASVRRKLERPDREGDISSLTDIPGIRIITFFRDDVDAVARLIEEEFLIDAERSVDKRAALEPDRFGYLSLHYIAQLNQNRSQLVEYSTYTGVRFEVQIRSILQHAWAEIEHDRGYKSEAEVPKTVRRRFSRLASLLELADDEFLGLRDELARLPRSGPSSLTTNLQFEIERLLALPQGISLPVWPRGWTEGEYNMFVSRTLPGFLLLDRILLEMPSSRGRFEACDLLGPNDELIHIGRGRNSTSLGHLFNQALVSTEFLVHFPEARQAFVDSVREHGAGRIVNPQFRPKEVVLAFPSSDGPVMSIENVPLFSRVTLFRVAEMLENLGTSLSIVGINQG
jgi:ppGpp synthetase/RelA/SpoT-type nucleotidyltranferase